MMGNVMYYVLTNQWIFEEYSNSVTEQKIIHGERSNIPAHIQKSTDRATRALLHAVEMCWVHNYKERPTARQVADYIEEELKRIEGVDELGVVRVEMPPLPKDHRYTDTDFYGNIWNR